MPPFSFHRPSLPWTTRRVPIDGAAPRVLVVDDNPDGALALATYLSLEQMASRTAFGGREAIEAATVWTPHVILMDVSMPDCNGIEAARVLRHDPRTSGIAIIAYTALDETEVRRQLNDDEFDGYLQKGRALSQLVELLTTFVQ